MPDILLYALARCIIEEIYGVFGKLMKRKKQAIEAPKRYAIIEQR